MTLSSNKIERAPEAATELFYERNASEYFAATVRADLSQLYDRFLAYVSPGGRILDAGSGSGRDTLAFLRRGYAVDAFDASPSLARLSTEHTGVRTQVMRLEDFKQTDRYDGIWACASLLHLHADALPDAMARLAHALKPGGALYVSFKYGCTERVTPDGRFFTDLDEPTLSALITGIPELCLREIWVSGGEDKFKGRGAWINAIAVRKMGT